MATWIMAWALRTRRAEGINGRLAIARRPLGAGIVVRTAEYV
jgi:hypothetical protein